MVESSPANAQGRLAKEKDGLLLVSTHVPDTAARIRSVALRHNLAVRALPRGGRIDEALAADEGAVLLMDLRFGGPHGAGSVAALRCDPRFAHAPVIALVGDKDDAAARDAVSAGANDFLRESMIERELPLKLLLVRRRMADAMSRRQEEAAARNAMIVELAGTAAHELNQPLTVVLGYAQLLSWKLEEGSPMARQVALLRKEAERMAEIVRKLGQITRYETTEYVDGAKIIDLDRSSVRESDLP
ncbi:MAG TPA: histidine kinase dimerization/phospho-acceptor domain-containing protein [Fredinandcohnia sp.]|nr:histidine kinase dimerization/phospho-acceptor domain-containing protein [Fredinandcohnia sp.]